MNVEKNENITASDIEKSLKTLSEDSWERANWPLITFVSKDVASYRYEESRDMMPFWKEAFNPKHFIYPNSRASYDSEKHMLFVLHSFSKPGEKDVTFKAISTTPKSLLKNPEHMINYIHHGKPCEDRSRGVSSYPTCSDFWEDFYDKVSETKQNTFPMPSSAWRKKFVLEKYFGK